jgi:hypothetical protein
LGRKYKEGVFSLPFPKTQHPHIASNHVTVSTKKKKRKLFALSITMQAYFVYIRYFYFNTFCVQAQANLRLTVTTKHSVGLDIGETEKQSGVQTK